MINATFIKGTSLPVRPEDAAVRAAGSLTRVLHDERSMNNPPLRASTAALGSTQGLRSGLARVNLEPFDGLTVPSSSRDKVREHRVDRKSTRLNSGYNPIL